MSKNTEKPELQELLARWKGAKETFRERLQNTGPGESLGVDPSIAIYKQIEQEYPTYFQNMEKQLIAEAITLLKSKGYKILKPETKTEYHEV